jgi:hypothetical protein
MVHSKFAPALFVSITAALFGCNTADNRAPGDGPSVEPASTGDAPEAEEATPGEDDVGEGPTAVALPAGEQIQGVVTGEAIAANCSVIQWCNKPDSSWGTVCVQQGCTQQAAKDECIRETYSVCGGPVSEWIILYQ